MKLFENLNCNVILFKNYHIQSIYFENISNDIYYFNLLYIINLFRHITIIFKIMKDILKFIKF